MEGKEIDFKLDKGHFEEGLFLEINLTGKDKLLCACLYRNGDTNDLNNELLIKLFHTMTSKKYSHLIIMGDFNFPDIDWDTLTSKIKNENDINVKFINCVRDCYLFQHVTEATRLRGSNEPSKLDLIFSNEENMVSDIEYLAPLGKSDHSVLAFTVKCRRDTSPPQIKAQYQKGDYTKMNQMFADSKWRERFEQVPDDVEAQWKIFKDLYVTAEKECIPRKLVYVNGCFSKKFSVPLDAKNLAKLKKKTKNLSKMRKIEYRGRSGVQKTK